MTPEGQAVLIAAGSATTAGAAGAVGVWALARHHVKAALVAAPLVVNASVGIGVVVTARSMFISEHDVSLVLLIVAAAAPIALAYGLLLARRVHRLGQEAAERIAQAGAARERDSQVETARRDLVAWASHDLRSPIAGIRAMAEALEDGVAPPNRAYPARIRAEADRMGAMVEDLLALSRIHAGRLQLRPEPVGLADLVSDALASARPLADAAGVHLDGHADGPLMVTADPRELSRVLDNLLANAIRATPRGGQVAVSALECPAVPSSGSPAPGAAGAPGGARVRVTDECGGIPQQVRERMFDPWWRGDQARTPGPGEGAGLGLSVVKGIVDAHGGTVAVHDHPGGCAIEVILPSGRG